MTVDLLHNKIIRETVTDVFQKSVNDNLIPKLYALYGTSLDGIQMYEDYINDEFIKDGYWYYPLTIVIDGINATLWIKWDISNSNNFYGGIPYAYIGEENIDFLIAEDVPFAFKNAIADRSTYFEGGYVKLNVTTDAPSATILAGKYSQTFIDEMNRQLSGAIAKACGVKGLEESSIEIDIVFAPNTYMEHTSENVTYRRLLISAKGCSPRDFWIKWIRRNSYSAFSVNDNVSSDDIIFELGEDVAQKTREKEYRFLVYGNSDRYRVAMGRKNITEWRELIKRAVKRGELTKDTAELELENHASEVSDKLSEILEKCGVAVPASEGADIAEESNAANDALLAVLEKEENDDSMEFEAAVKESDELAKLKQVSLEISEELENGKDYAQEFKPFDESDIFSLEIADGDGEFAKTEATDEFDFGVEPEQVGFELPDTDAPELTMEDILEEFIPKSEPKEEEEYEQIKADFDISEINESESVRIQIAKSDSYVFEEDEIEEAESEEDEDDKDGSEFEEEIEIEENEELKENEELEIAEEPEEEEHKSVSAYSEESIIRLEAEVANGRRIAELERIEKENVEAKLENEMMAKAKVECELIDERASKSGLEAELEILRAEKLALEENIEALRGENRELEAAIENERASKIELSEKISALESASIEAEQKLHSANVAKENAQNQTNLERLAAADLRAQIEKQKFAIEQVKKLVEEETNTRKLAEAEAERLRAECEVLQSENVRLVEAARIAEEACSEAEKKCKEHEENLLLQIELHEKEKTREKNLFAEAAKQAKEENERYLAECAEAEALRVAEEKRIEELRRAEEERIREEEALQAEKQRIEAEAEQRLNEIEARRKAIEERARAARLRMEENARINAEARASESSEYSKPKVAESEYAESEYATEEYTAPSYEETNAPSYEPEYEPTEAEATTSEIINDIYAENEAPIPVSEEPDMNYTYTSKLVRLLFRNSVDPNITSRLHEMISFALAEFKKEHLYIKVKASNPDNTTVILNFVKFPEEEMPLLVKIINYLGHSDLGIYKIILE